MSALRIARVWTFTKSGISEAQAAPAQTQHRVLLVQRLDRREEHAILFGGGVAGLGDLDQLLLEVRQELVERRVDQADDDGQAVHRPEDALEVALLEDLELAHGSVEGVDRLGLLDAQLGAAGRLGLGAGRGVGHEDRTAHDLEPFALAEHVLGPAQADALRAVAPREGRLLRLVGVRPDLHAADLVGPTEDRLKLGLVLEPGGDGRQRTDEHLAGRAIEADPVAFRERDVVGGRGLRGVVDRQLVTAGDARLADLARHDRGVARRAAASGQDALGHGHAVEVIGRGLDPDEDDALAAGDPLDRDVGIEHGTPDRRARRGVETLGDARRLRARPRIELVAQELVHVGRLDPGERLLLRDPALVDEVGGDLHRRGRGPLRAPRLEHVQLSTLDREFEILDVAVMAFELLADAHELGIDLGHVGLHLRDLGRGPDAGHDVLALRICQVLPEQDLLPGVGVAREGDPGPRVVAHVAEDHGHHVDRSAQVVGDLLVVAVVDGALAEPAREDGLDREIELLVRIAWEVAPRVLADDRP